MPTKLLIMVFGVYNPGQAVLLNSVLQFVEVDANSNPAAIGKAVEFARHDVELVEVGRSVQIMSIAVF